jgi:hypothetical protein
LTEQAAPSLAPKVDRYLRNRPFLIISLIQRPAKGVRTEKKGWKEVTGNLDAFEQPSLVDRVNAVHLRNANVIIDVTQTKVIKNNLVNTPDEDVMDYYLNKYEAQITEAMDVWLTNEAKRLTVAQVADAGVAEGTFSLA